MKPIEINIDNYIREVVISKAVRAKYKLNKDGDKVVSNPRSAGKPRYKKINGQDLWSGINHNLRSKIAKELKIFFYEHFRNKKIKIKKKDYPLSIAIIFYGPLGEFDLDNHSSWYRKCIQDALCGNVEFDKVIDERGKKSYVPDRKKYPAIIEDDSVLFVRDIPCSYVESEEYKLKIIIKKIEDVPD